MLTELKRLRLEKGLTQQEVANELDMSISMLAMMENGYRRGGDETKMKIANFYGKSVESLFFNQNSHLKCLKERKKGLKNTNSGKKEATK